MEAFDVGFQLFHGRRAQQGTGDKRLTTHEGQRHLCRVKVMPLRDIDIGRHRFLRLLAAIARKTAEQRIARAGRFCAIEVLPGQRTEREAGIGQQFNAFVLANFRQAHFIAAVHQAVRVLDRHNARQVVFIRKMKVTHDAKCCFVGNADIANFAGTLEFSQSIQRIQESDDRRGIGPGVAQFAETVGWALRPVYLIEIEIIGLQALQAVVKRLADIFTIQLVVRTDAAVVIAGRAADFRGDNQLLAVTALRQPVADVGFRQTLGFRARRDGIHFSDIDQVYALAHGVIELLMGVCLAILLTKRHCAQPQRADFKRTVWDTVILHSRLPFFINKVRRSPTKEYKNGRGEEKGEVKKSKKPGWRNQA